MIPLHTRKLTVGYREAAVVSGLDIQALAGQMVGVLGPNGSGKTTILRTISGLLAPVSGATYILGRNTQELSPQELATQLAVVLTEPIDSEYLTVLQVVAAGRYPHTGRLGKLSLEDLIKVQEALRQVRGEYLADRSFNQLSDGERQKVLLARALAQETPLIILDEPTRYLDVKNRFEFLGLLGRLCREQGLTVILSLHELDVALKWCTSVLLVKGGAILDFGAPEAVLTMGKLQDLYDLKSVAYNLFLGDLEMPNVCEPQILVIGGNGCGAPVYRFLTKRGYGFATGILHQNDLDFQVGRSMGVPIISSAPFEPINPSVLSLAMQTLEAVRLVIDTGFTVGITNRANMDLIRQAVTLGKPVVTWRRDSESWFGDISSDLQAVSTFSQLEDFLKGILGELNN